MGPKLSSTDLFMVVCAEPRFPSTAVKNIFTSLPLGPSSDALGLLASLKVKPAVLGRFRDYFGDCNSSRAFILDYRSH